MGARAAECPDIEAFGAEGRDQGRIVDLGIVGQGHDRGAAVGMQQGQGVVRPGVGQLDTGEAQIRGEGAARIDHRHRVAGKARHGDERLRYVHGTHHHHPERGIEDLDEDAAPLPVDGGAAIVPDRLEGCLECFLVEGQAAARTAVRDEGLLARLEVGRKRRRPLAGTRFLQAP